MTTAPEPRVQIAVAGQLPSPPKNGHHCVFTNLSDKSNIEVLRTDVLSARPDLKKYASIEFEITEVSDSSEVSDPADPSASIAVRSVVSEAQGLQIPLILISTDLHYAMDRLPVEQGKRFRVSLSRGFK